MSPTPDEEAARALVREFRRHRRGVALVDSRPLPFRFVTDQRTGSLIAPVESGVARSEEIVLFLPDERDDALQLLLDLEPGQVTEELQDRWKTHHGIPPGQAVGTTGGAGFSIVAPQGSPGDDAGPYVWARFEIEGARMAGRLVDGDEFMGPNPLAMVEPKACKRANADRAALGLACKVATGADLTDPVCVGIDPGGVHVRGRLGVLRIDFPREAPTPEDAERALEDLLRRGGGV